MKQAILITYAGPLDVGQAKDRVLKAMNTEGVSIRCTSYFPDNPEELNRVAGKLLRFLVAKDMEGNRDLEEMGESPREEWPPPRRGMMGAVKTFLSSPEVKQFAREVWTGKKEKLETGQSNPHS